MEEPGRLQSMGLLRVGHGLVTEVIRVGQHTYSQSGSDGKESSCTAGDPRDVGSIPGSGRSPGERNSYPLQHSCLENTMDRGACQATVQGVA